MAVTKIKRTKDSMTFASGATCTFDSGSTLVVSGTLTISATNLTASGAFATTTTLASGTTLTAGTSLAVTTTSVLSGNVTIGNGYAGTGSTLTALGAASFKGNLIVDGSATVGSLVIGAGGGTITDAADVLTLTETNLSLVGIVGITGATNITGATAVTGALSCTTTFSAGAANHFAIDANGLVTLNNTIVIDGHTTTDILVLGGRVAVCNDTSPSAVPADHCVIYYDGSNLKAATAAGTATLNDAAFS